MCQRDNHQPGHAPGRQPALPRPRTSRSRVRPKAGDARGQGLLLGWQGEERQPEPDHPGRPAGKRRPAAGVQPLVVGRVLGLMRSRRGETGGASLKNHVVLGQFLRTFQDLRRTALDRLALVSSRPEAAAHLTPCDGPAPDPEPVKTDLTRTIVPPPRTAVSLLRSGDPSRAVRRGSRSAGRGAGPLRDRLGRAMSRERGGGSRPRCRSSTAGRSCRGSSRCEGARA